MTRGDRVIAFIERYCCVPEGARAGKPLRLMEFQKRFIRAVYDNPAGTSRAYLSIGRKNGKSALIACLVLAHIVGPEAVLNSQIISGARSREQAALVFKLAQKMIYFSADLRQASRIVPSQKTIIGKARNVEYRAISAEAGTAHGLSPVLAILDEVGQIKGPEDDFVEAITTSQGAYEAPLLIAISTQAATDNDLFSRWLDDAAASKDARIVSHCYTAPADCDVMDRAAWRAANPALGEFRALADMEDLAQRAARLPAEENSFRWLFLNQRIEATAPFISRAVWKSCGEPVAPLKEGAPIFAGLDLSEVNDLTAFVMVTPVDNLDSDPVTTRWDVHPVFWLPGASVRERAKKDRVPYEEWAAQGFIEPTTGATVDYEFVAARLWSVAQKYDLKRVNFDRYNMRHLRPWLIKAGFAESQVEGDDAIFQDFGQGFVSMSPALRDLEGAILNGALAHGGHPVLTMCAANAVVQRDPAGNRKLAKHKSRGRIDGMVALAMAMSAAGVWKEPAEEGSYMDTGGLLVL